ncbi:MAG: ribosome biogenesis GTPase YlqF, partial [Clostridia bacterium]|nr:ribosome biogenesis GTPase YlqF [Clostridia bacterium]
MPGINWYPGHMAKTRRLLQEQVKSVDAVIELCDARAPGATRNPDLVNMIRGKNHFLILNKCDLANENATR